MASLTERMIGAAKLDVHTYEEVERDPGAMGQAMGVVILSSIAAGIGSGGRMAGLFFVAVAALVGWFVWAGLIYLVGTRILPEPETQADMGQLLRTIGFAASPGVLRILGVIPVLGMLIGLAVSIWMLATTVVAVRQALDYRSTGKAIAVCVIGWIVYLVVTVILVGMFGGMAGISRGM